MPSLDEIYTAEWFAHDFEGLLPEFHLVARGIDRTFGGSLAADIGCGPGMLLNGLRVLGWNVWGIDGSRHAIDAAKRWVPETAMFLEQLDLLTDLGYRESVDLVICTEVAEHIEERSAPDLVAQLTRLLGSDGAIVFTAAPPGQDGHHHVNCQPKDYWRELFADHALIEDVGLTAELTVRWRKLRRLSHMTRNVMVFR